MNWSHVSNQKLIPQGFSFSGIAAGLKDSKNKDLALILAPKDTLCTGLFTQSNVRASCVDLCERRINNSSGFIRAILINSGHANACTGKRGIDDCLKVTKELSQILGIQEEQILICSTGVIGIPIPITNLINNLPLLVNKLDHENYKDASEAILTTDKVTKTIALETYIEGRPIKIAAIAKGSGMIYPNMATMLAFLTCDVKVERHTWTDIVKKAVHSSFNAISVDGETSTNDSFIALNSGQPIEDKFLPIIQEGIIQACQTLAKAIARDGEGANCLIEIVVAGAKDDANAIKIAKSIVNSALVKTAIHGCDPNWGRIIAAAGNAGIEFSFENIDLMIGNYDILQKGKLKKYDHMKVSRYMRSKMHDEHLQDPLQIILNLNIGKGNGKAWGCDFSRKYIEINSEYTT